MFAFTSWMFAFTRIRTVTFIITAVVIPIFLGVQSLITIGAVAMVIVFAKYMATVSYIAHFTGLWQTLLVVLTKDLSRQEKSKDNHESHS
jgi:hypothetical protein